MNERSKTTSAEQGVLEKHDTLQTVQAPTASVLTKSVQAGLHTMLQGKGDPSPTKVQIKRGIKAKRATITRG